MSAKKYFFAVRNSGEFSVVQLILRDVWSDRDVGAVGGRDRLLLAICRRGETAEPGDDFDHDGIQSLR